MLIAKAWGLPQESLQASLDLLAKERQLLRSGSGEDALPDSELLEPYDGRMIVELLWACLRRQSSWRTPGPGGNAQAGPAHGGESEPG